MIVTLTLNVALDQYYHVPAFTKGDVHRAAKNISSAGGKGLNVARVIRQLGFPVLAVGLTGGHTGQRVVELLDRDQIPHRFTDTGVETRECINIVDENSISTEVLGKGEEISPEVISRFIQDFEEVLGEASLVTMSGSVMKGMPVDIYAQLIGMCSKRNIPVVLDTSGEYLAKGLEAAPFVIKPNIHELEQLFGTKLETEEQVITFGNKLLDNGIKNVIVSLGEKGALFISKKGVLRATPPKLDIINTVGSGDSMVAAIACSMIDSHEDELKLQLAIAVSAANTLSEKTGDISTELVEQILPQVAVKNMERG
ncbi:1-phosphofructokinase [Psychrobacillus sp. FSL K6-2836]|uniref:1-phosphofructokinase n=1 Tax=Psychrobacillus sp. FSL K6-2836 TaxID=2921548 RepID=UPI0030FC5E76